MSWVAYSVSGFPTLECWLVKEGACIHLDYTIIAPFVSRGEKHRQSWCWSEDYPAEKLFREARESMVKLASQMWGEHVPAPCQCSRV